MTPQAEARLKRWAIEERHAGPVYASTNPFVALSPLPSDSTRSKKRKTLNRSTGPLELRRRETTSRPKAKARKKVNLTPAGRRDLLKAKAASYALHEAMWQDKLLKGKQSTSTARADLERARRLQRIRKLSR